MIILTQFRPPSEDIKRASFAIKGVKLGDLKGDSEKQMLTGLELASLSQDFDSPEKVRVTVIEEYPDHISPNRIVGLAELASHRWREVIVPREVVYTDDFKVANPYTKIDLTDEIVELVEDGVALCSNKRFSIALDRWNSAIHRHDPLDIVLDLSSCLEACFSLSYELRLRLSLAVRAVLLQDARESAKAIYEMYGIRSRFTHGSNSPEVSQADSLKYAGIVSEILISIIGRGNLPTAEEITTDIFSR